MFEVLVSHWGLTPMWHDLSVEILETDTSYSVVYEFNLEMTGGIFNLCNSTCQTICLCIVTQLSSDELHSNFHRL